MTINHFPQLSDRDVADCVERANSSHRRRHPRILHQPGDVFNRVINFMMHDSYMQPHHHPGVEKVEHIYLMEGRLTVLFFDVLGNVESTTRLEPGGNALVIVPAFAWHTYVMESDQVVTYETMMGKYEPDSWKEMAAWAPVEGTEPCADYLRHLKSVATSHAGPGFNQRNSSDR